MRITRLLTIGALMCGLVAVAAPAASASTRVIPVPKAIVNSGAYGYLTTVAPDTSTIRVVLPASADLAGKPATYEIQGYDTITSGSASSAATSFDIAVDPSVWSQRSAPCPAPIGTEEGCFVLVVNGGRFNATANLQLDASQSLPVITVDYGPGGAAAEFVVINSLVVFPESKKGDPIVARGDRVVLRSGVKGFWTVGPTGAGSPIRPTAALVGQWDDCRNERSATSGYGGCAESVALTVKVSKDGKRLTVRIPRTAGWSTPDPDTEFINVAWERKRPRGTDTFTMSRVIQLR